MAPLRSMQLPLVFEHGDLSYPNLLLLPTGEPGVLDWELANPDGLPACDLFLFLTYVAFSGITCRRAAPTVRRFKVHFLPKRRADKSVYPPVHATVATPRSSVDTTLCSDLVTLHGQSTGSSRRWRVYSATTEITEM